MTANRMLPVEDTVKDALDQFKKFGCAEAVLLAVSKASGNSWEGVPAIASGLQGGLMAGEVCGAVTGAALAIGLIYGEDPEMATHLTEEFMRRFKDRHGKVRCMDIIGFNVGSANTGLEISSKKDFFLFLARGGKRSCKKILRDTVEVLVEQLNEWES